MTNTTPKDPRAEASEPMFPIMVAPSIPLWLIAPYEAQAQRNHGQTLKRLAERGGLSICEAMAVMSSVSYDKRPIAKPTVEDWLDFIAERKARAAKRFSPSEPVPASGGVEAAKAPTFEQWWDGRDEQWREESARKKIAMEAWHRGRDAGTTISPTPISGAEAGGLVHVPEIEKLGWPEEDRTQWAGVVAKPASEPAGGDVRVVGHGLRAVFYRDGVYEQDQQAAATEFTASVAAGVIAALSPPTGRW